MSPINDDVEQAKISILLIEDDVDDFYIFRSMLAKNEDTSYEWHHALNLKSAFAIWEKTAIDVVLLDLNLGYIHGLDTLQAVIAHSPEAPIIVLTGINEKGVGKKAIQLGAADYLAKKQTTSEFLARSIAYAIERFNLVEELKRRADEDSLTGLANRSALFKKLNVLTEQCKRNSLPLAILMIDLDGFKAVNDEFGHQLGDELLQQVAQRLETKLRKSDIAARLGGDEFVVVLTNFESREQIKVIADKKLEGLRAPYLLNDQKQTITISASIGVVEWTPEMSVQKLMTLADDHMYQSKKLGKDQVSFYEAEH